MVTEKTEDIQRWQAFCNGANLQADITSKRF